MPVAIDRFSSLIIIDVQNDFCPGGALAVRAGDEIVKTLNDYIAKFHAASAVILASRDWHPKRHISFKERGGSWDPHCIQGSRGADFHPDLSFPFGTSVLSKGILLDQEVESVFEGTDLLARLEERQVKRVFIGGLATDECFKNTVLDSCRLGFETFLLADAVRGISVNSKKLDPVVQELREAGAKPVRIGELVRAKF